MMTALSPEQIKELLTPKRAPRTVKAPQEGVAAYPTREQYGPLRWYDKEMRCTSKRCGSSTYCKLNGMPLCHVHALQELNQMYYKLMEGGEFDNGNRGSSTPDTASATSANYGTGKA